MIKLKEILIELTASDIDLMYGGPSAKKYNINIAFRKFDPKTNMITFKAWDTMGSGRQHAIQVIMLDFNKIQDKSYTNEQLLEMALKDGDIKVRCTCNSFHYNGFAYLSTALDGAIKNEPRKPIVRNPLEEGIVCKHIKGLLEKIDKYIPTIAKKIPHV